MGFVSNRAIDKAVGFFRICPRCYTAFANDADWHARTEVVGAELRESRHLDFLARFVVTTVELVVRRHTGCGGENYSRGVVLRSRPAED